MLPARPAIPFDLGDLEPLDLPGGVFLDEDSFRVTTMILDHKIPCLAFALEERAAERGHLTARQAGHLAREAAVKQFVPIHFSPRYARREDALRREAQDAFDASP